MMDEWMQKRMDFSKQYQENKEKEMIYDANQEQVELDELKQSFQKIHEKCRNEADKIEKQIGLNKLDDMVLEALIDDLMMERDARTYANEAETNFYRDVGL